MKRFSIYLLYGVTILTLVSIYDFEFTRRNWLSFYLQSFVDKASQLNGEAHIARAMHESFRDVDLLTQFLESRRQSGSVNFWILYRGDEVVDTSFNPDELPRFQFDRSRDVTVVGPALNTDDLFYAIENLPDDLQVIVGVIYNEKAYLVLEAKAQAEALGRYLIGLIVLVMGTFIFFFRDFSRLLRQLASHQKGAPLDLSSPVSKEAEILQRGLAAFDTKTEQLEGEKNVLSAQVLSSLKTEIASGRKPPYVFQCTMVRTDINNFSRLYNERPVEEFAATVNSFFVQASHVIARYGGYLHEFVGDEIIYYFKDDECEDSALLALYAIQKINELAERMDQETQTKHGHSFTVKSAFANGNLRFGPLVSGFSLSGPPLIETVRLLAQIHEKDGNVAVFDERHSVTSSPLIRHAPYATVQLKGLSGERNLLIFKGHRALDEILKTNDQLALRDLIYYRGDSDVERILHWLQDSGPALPEPCALTTVEILRSFTPTNISEAVQTRLLDWIEDLIRKVSAGQPLNRVLASALRLTEIFLLDEIYRARGEIVLKRALDLSEPRIIANALDALNVVNTGGSDDLGWLVDLTHHFNNRVAANALVRISQAEIHDDTIAKLRRMLKSARPEFTASALWAIGQIADHHRKHDLIYYQTQLRFHSLLSGLPAYVTHTDEHIRRQAMRAVKLSGDEILIAEARLTVARTGRKDLMREADEFLGERVRPPGRQSRAS